MTSSTLTRAAIAEAITRNTTGVTVSYLRISRDREGRELGVDRQHDDCLRLAGILGLTLGDVVRENDRSASAFKKHPRPLWDALIERVRSGEVTHIIAATMSRLTRDMVEREELLALRFVGLTVTTASGQRIYPGMSASEVQVIRMLGVNDTAESELISERTRGAFAQAAERGMPHGPIPYGWNRVHDRTGIVETIDEDQAAVVREVAARMIDGEATGAIVRDLNARGLTGPRGGAWSTMTLSRVMLRERNIGQRVHQGEVVETKREDGRGVWPPILDDDTYAAVVAHLRDPRRVAPRGAQKHLLSGLLTCGRCGSKRVYVAVSGKAVPGYHCKDCRGVRRAQWSLDEYVTDVVCARLARPDALDWLAQDAGALDAARARVEALRGKLAERTDMFDAGDMDRASYTRSSERIRAEIAQAEAAVEVARPVPGSVRSMIGLGSVEDVRAAWDRLPLGGKRDAVRSLMTITVLPTKRRRLDPDSIRIEWTTAA